MLKAYLGSGPFVFCDYWASVLGLRSVLNPRLLSRGLVSLKVFKRGLDRPRAKLPKFKYYLLAFFLGPGLIPYKVVIDLAILLRSKTRGKVLGKVDAIGIFSTTLFYGEYTCAQGLAGSVIVVTPRIRPA